MKIEFDKKDVANVQMAIIESIANRVIDNALLESSRQKIFDSGTYDKSWEKRVEGRVTKVTTIVKNVLSNEGDYEGFDIVNPTKTSFVAEVGNTAAHAALIEWGTEWSPLMGGRKFFPNVDRLKDWAMRVKGEDDKTAERSAWAMAKHFEKEGFKAHNVLLRAIVKTISEMGGE